MAEPKHNNGINEFVGFFLYFHIWFIHVTLSAVRPSETSQSSSAPAVESVGKRWQYPNRPPEPYPYNTYGGTEIDSQPPSQGTSQTIFVPYASDTGKK